MMMYEIEFGQERGCSWGSFCKQVPFVQATDCKSVYDLFMKTGSLSDEKRVALDLMDERIHRIFWRPDKMDPYGSHVGRLYD